MADPSDRAALGVADVLALLLPAACAGCGSGDIALCAACAAQLRPLVTRRRLPVGLEVHSALVFDGVPARVLRALKEEGRTPLARPLGAALAAAVASVAAPDGALFVPMPSSRAAMRRRGFRPVELLSVRAGLRPARLLRPARRTADQRGLRRDERADNVAGSLVATRCDGMPVVLVDDVITTGATLGEAHRALAEAGAHVLAAVTVASTTRRFGAGENFLREHS